LTNCDIKLCLSISLLSFFCLAILC
jgi:hypothetical protein